MLVLTRRIRESVVLGISDGLGHTIKVTVLRVRGGEVRLGFEGPPQVAVHRLEVWERIRSPHGAREKHDVEGISEEACHVGAFGH